MACSVVFEMVLPEKSISTFVLGTLILKTTGTTGGIRLQATSGLPGYQYSHSWVLKRKGCIPPSSAIGSLRYSISTQRLYMPTTAGVQGGFFAIAPFSVPLGNVSRGDFGCHQDMGVKGSAGCVVFPPPDHWGIFEDWMLQRREDKIQSVPLEVVYH